MDNNLSHNEPQEGSLVQAILNVTRGKNIVEGTIAAVDETAYTCTVQVRNAVFFDVPLMVNTGSAASILQIPAVNTDCLLCFKDGLLLRPQLFSVNECDKFLITIGNSTLEVTSDLFKFNGGMNGGMVLVNNLVTRMNNIENAHNSHVHILTLSSGTGTAAPTTDTVTPTTAADIESQVILQ